MKIGDTRTIGKWQIHRFSSSIRILQLAGAGKRGARCMEIAIYGIPDTYSCSGRCSSENQAIDYVVKACIKRIEEFAAHPSCADPARMLKDMEGITSTMRYELKAPGIAIEHDMRKGVEVALPEIDIATRALTLHADGVRFSIQNPADTYNLETEISRTRGQARKCYDWAARNTARLPSMTFRQVSDAISKETKVGLHYYCAVD
jgi:hypothetical protein